MIGFGEEELDWLSEHLKKVVELEASKGFIRKIRGKTRTHLMKICFNSRGRFMKITKFVTKRKPVVLVVPEGVKGNGWEALRKAISLVQDLFDQAVRASKETIEDSQVSKRIYKGGRSYADVVPEEGPRNKALLPVGKWARAVIYESKGKVQDWFYVGKTIARMMGMKRMVSVTPISAYKGFFFVDSARRADWFHDQGSLTMRGGPIFQRRWSPRENTIVFENFRKGWLELRGLPFHLWDEVQLRYILQKWGKVTKVAWDSLKLVNLSKVKLWVEMLPNVVLFVLLEVEDGAWLFTVAVSVIGEVEGEDLLRSESTRSKDELMSVEGCVSQRPKNAAGRRATTRDNECYNWRPLYRSRSRSSVSNLAEKGSGGSLLGPAVGSIIEPTKPDALFKARPVRA